MKYLEAKGDSIDAAVEIYINNSRMRVCGHARFFMQK